MISKKVKDIVESPSNGVIRKMFEEGASNLSKEETGKLAERQEKFIKHLKDALIRIENKNLNDALDVVIDEGYRQGNGLRQGSQDH